MIRALLVVLATVAVTIVSGGPAAASEFRKGPAAGAAAQLRLAPSEANARGARIYIVQMAAKPAVSYQGDTAGFAKTAPAPGKRYDARSSEAQQYAQRLVSQHDMLLASIGASGGKLYSYVHTMNGFAARLTASQAARLRKSQSVRKVWEDRIMQVDTNNTPNFLGLNNPETGLRAAHDLHGRGVIIGVIDSGAVQEHPSFEDNGFAAPPAHWNGICQSGEGWSSSDCNNKLIGARWFAQGFTSGSDLVEGEFLSPRDSDGHGTHTATTAAGIRTRASLNGKPLAFVSGMADRARIAVYKACWQAPGAPSAGCTFSDTAAATEAAIGDGVDVINFSVGTAAAFDDPQDIAFLGALAAGVFVARSAGNEGPGPASTAAGEPWVTTVAASTHSGQAYTNAVRVNAPAAVAGDYAALEGAITQPLLDIDRIEDSVQRADPLRACVPIAPVDGIVLIARGTCDFTVKITHAVEAGARAVIVYSQEGNPKVIMGGDATEDTLSIPGVMVDFEVGIALREQLENAQAVDAKLSALLFTREPMTGDVMAEFSSRGPFATEGNWLKPDLSAPGVQVFAGDTPEPNDGSPGGFFQYLSGTSMSTPHVAGVAALLLEAHPDWTPAMIKSALMTTARRNLVKEDGATKADPFDMGAGRIAPNRALDPGLTYSADSVEEYLAASCGTDTPLVSPDDCNDLGGFGYSLDPADLNLPSIAADEILGSKVVRRAVVNVSDAAATYTAKVVHPPGFRVTVEPASLTLDPGEPGLFEVTIRHRDAPAGAWRFGSLNWSDGTHNVYSPIAANAVTVAAEEEVAGEGSDGSGTFAVTFGYEGSYSNDAHGLVEPFLTQVPVTDDPFDSFDFSLEDDEPLVYLLEAPEGATALQFSLFNAYNDKAGHDLDLYVFYCPDFLCTQVGGSFTASSNEQVRIPFPLNDPDITDPYAVFVHGFNTVGGAPADSIFFDWTVEGATGNLEVDPSAATVGEGETIDVTATWSGLTAGPAEKWLGGVSHSDESGIQDLTYVNVENDEGSGYCDLVGC